jgi:hypothetical protein
MYMPSSLDLKCFVIIFGQAECFHLSVEVEVCKALENLFQRRLTDRVLVDVVDCFYVVDHPKHLADGLVLVRNPQLHVVAVLFYHFNFARIVRRVTSVRLTG